MPTVEIAGFPLVHGVSMASIGDDPSSDAAVRIKEWSEAIVKQKGYQAASFGTVEENPTDLVAIIVWDDVQAHIETLRQPEYKAVAERISAIFTGAGYMYHVDLEPHSEVQKALAAPVTQIATFYFDDEPPEEYSDTLKAFQEAALKESEGPAALAVGITYEEVEHEDVKGKAAILLYGWNDIKAHEAFRSSSAYREHGMKLAEGVVHEHAHHMALRTV